MKLKIALILFVLLPVAGSAQSLKSSRETVKAATIPPAIAMEEMFVPAKDPGIKIYVLLGEGTHTVMMEKNRMELFREVQMFLDQGAPKK